MAEGSWGSVSSWTHTQYWLDIDTSPPRNAPKVKIFINPNICKWCQSIPPFPATSQDSVCLPIALFASSPFTSALLLGVGRGGQQSCFSGVRQPVPWGAARFSTADSDWSALPESCGLSFAGHWLGTGWTPSPTHPVGLEASCICMWRSGLA